ncbi:hypothetical protein [Flavihumibacter sp. ZG627]|uniref:hypothetical protein n=1 Tax=Flavihumibacter sp. ZG627 TaxID=1463156 RepID=UPI00057E78B2|nr:hypothetical protein [Flavihumibacter sp. ZG627]KIC91643.1 hypothetical protein HY58_05250 [Flavihumibacter sp. ZG627]
MPEIGPLIAVIDNLTLLALLLTAAILLIKKGWEQKLQLFILLHVLYNLFLFGIVYIYPMDSPTFQAISNLTIHIDTITGLLFFYFLWDDIRYRKFLLITIIPVIATWMLTLFIKGIYRNTFWNQLLPSFWYMLAAGYAMVLLYRNSSLTVNTVYVSRFLLIAGFLFYNFIFLVLQTFYIYFTSISDITDAWNINYWAYFIFRLLMLAGVIFWFRKPAALQPIMR